MALTTQKMAIEAISFSISILCFGYVLYRASECLSKFNLSPNSTETGIEPASSHPYPAFTICYYHANHWYTNTLEACGLTFDQYFLEKTWTGQGDEPFCSDPQKLFETMTLTQDLLKHIKVVDQNSQEVYYNTSDRENVYYSDTPEDGRCITFYPPAQVDMKYIEMTFGRAEVEVYVHSPGSTRSAFYEYDEIEIGEGEQLVTKILHEIFEVLSFGNERCLHYQERRGQDACLNALIHKVWTFLKTAM